MNEFEEIRTGGESAIRASQWIAKIDRGLTDREESGFKAWLFESDENYSTFMAMAKVWDRMDSLASLADICPESARTTNQLRRYALPIAATVALAAMLAAWGLVELRNGDLPANLVAQQTDIYETGIGGRSTFDLSDGTRIVLNTNSRVRIHYTNSNRFLDLERGEMHVKVAHDPSRPLSVMVGDRVVQAVGTEFNVEITDDKRIELVVTEGVVLIGVLDEAVANSMPDQPVILTQSSAVVAAGQEVVIEANQDSADGIAPKPLNSDDIAVKLSWREGNLIFRGESLEEAISEVGRYTEVKFIFLDEMSKKKSVSGFYRAGDVDALLASLRQNFNISYEWVAEDKVAFSLDNDSD